MLVLSSFFFIKEERVLGLDISNLIVQSEEVVFEVFEFEEFFFERGDDCVFMS